MTKNNKVVLAYSGGLDTSYCAKYLSEDRGLEVHALTVDTGGFSEEELKNIETRAFQLGVKTFKIENVVTQYYEKCIKFLIYGNVLKNNTYPLSVSAERVFQAMAIANYAKSIGAAYVAHGSTGAIGNDQVRFDMIFNIVIPEAEIITPIRDNKLSEEAEIEYLAQKGFEIDAKKAAYSINKGIWGTSVVAKKHLAAETPFLKLLSQPNNKIYTRENFNYFQNGEPIGLNGKIFQHPTQTIEAIEQLATPFGIGRDVHVGDTIIGIKGRVGFEAAAALIIIKAHHLLEKHTLTKQQLFWKDQLATVYGNFLHEGLYYEPTMRDIEQFFISSQARVSGEVFITLKPYQFILEGIDSPFDLMQSKFGTYGEMNNAWTGDDVKGFAKIFSNQMMIHKKMEESNSQDKQHGK